MLGRKKEIKSMDFITLFIGVIQGGIPSFRGHSIQAMHIMSVFYDSLPFRYRIKINKDDLIYAVLFIDIGKMSIPPDIRNKAGKLSPEEHEVMNKYDSIGADMLADIYHLKDIAGWLRYYRERIDGNGQYHLKDKEIPLASRLMAIVDTYLAITIPQAHRPVKNHEDALFELRLVAGTQLDKELVEIFCGISDDLILGSIKEADSETIAIQKYMMSQVPEEKKV